MRAAEMGVRCDLLIGIGNPLRGDDGVGPALLDALAAELGGWRTASAELKTVHQLTPELALAVVGAQRVLFLDACMASPSAEPWIERLRLPETPAEFSWLLGGHQWAPLHLLALAQSLYGWRGEGALLRVPAFAFPHGPSFSTPLLQALPRAKELMHGWLLGDERLMATGIRKTTLQLDQLERSSQPMEHQP
ncbi:MAG: hydrogenase maturation protease [Cyanobium sp.]